MEEADILKAIQQRWIHSHEEDSENEMVFRPSSYDFPLSRGRAGFELKPDHTLVQLNIAPTDGPAEASGSWRLKTEGPNNLTLELDADAAGVRRYSVKSVEPDRLVVEKEE